MKFLIALSTLALGVTAVPPNNPGAVVPSSVTSDDTLSTKAPATAVAAVMLVRDYGIPTVSVNSAGKLQQGFDVHQPKDWLRAWGSLYVPELFHYNFDDLDDGSPEAEAMRQLMKEYPDIDGHRHHQSIFDGRGKPRRGAKPASTKRVSWKNIQARAIPSAPATISAVPVSTIMSIIGTTDGGKFATKGVPLFSIINKAALGTEVASPTPGQNSPATTPEQNGTTTAAERIVTFTAPAQTVTTTVHAQVVTTTVPLYSFLTKVVPGPAVTLPPPGTYTTTAPARVITQTLPPGIVTKTIDPGVVTFQGGLNQLVRESLITLTGLTPTGRPARSTINFINPEHNFENGKITKEDIRKAAAFADALESAYLRDEAKKAAETAPRKRSLRRRANDRPTRVRAKVQDSAEVSAEEEAAVRKMWIPRIQKRDAFNVTEEKNNTKAEEGDKLGKKDAVKGDKAVEGSVLGQIYEDLKGALSDEALFLKLQKDAIKRSGDKRKKEKKEKEKKEKGEKEKRKKEKERKEKERKEKEEKEKEEKEREEKERETEKREKRERKEKEKKLKEKKLEEKKLEEKST